MPQPDSVGKKNRDSDCGMKHAVLTDREVIT